MARSKQHKRKVKTVYTGKVGAPPYPKEKYVSRMTFCIPSKNNLRYVKVAIESIRKNAMRDDHYIHILVDKNDDKCYEWLMENKDENTIVKLNERGECLHYPPQFAHQLRRAKPSSPFMHKE